jgi:hypothetical protein
MLKRTKVLKSKLLEGLEYGDLRRLVRPYLQIDGFKSKMGDDDDMVVLCFTVGEKLPAEDFMNFLEMGYEGILDADVSPGEKDDGSYLVFVEMQRDPRLPETMIEIVQDVLNLTGQDLEDWYFTYYRDRARHPLTIEQLTAVIPLTPKEYRARYEKKPKKVKEPEQSQPAADQAEMNQLRATAGVPVSSGGPQSPEIQEMQIAAGIPISTH